jgi:cellulose synthase/poly-beta-1,6-N-acetylglucosamine synthase-like glycosyltransferase/peptidoglycan/xylan/chitin deacetylase (PgdA/CDA1 family)
MNSESRPPIFYDPRQQRWRRLRLIGIVCGMCLAALALILFVSIATPPSLHAVDFTKAHDFRKAREYQKPQEASLHRVNESLAAAPPMVVGFFVNWDGASFSSLKEHLSQLDLLVPEWIHLGGDSKVSAEGKVAGKSAALVFETPSYQRMVVEYLQSRHSKVPIMPLVNNLHNGVWDSAGVHAMLATKDSRQRVEKALLVYVRQNDFAGISIDFENIPEADQEKFAAFIEETCAAFHAAHLKVSVSLPSDNLSFNYSRISSAVDYVILMMYDEHTSKNAPGPVSGIGWFRSMLAAREKDIPASKLIVALGNYAYDWQHGKDPFEETFDEAVLTANESSSTIAIDPASLNPTYKYYDEANILHTVWLQDATTAFNEYRSLGAYRPHGVALWRLGSEDLGVWSFLGKSLSTSYDAAFFMNAFQSVRYGYNVDYEGMGEILQLTSLPKMGARVISYDSKRELITSENYVTYPSPYVITRHGKSDHAIALTFDDGPDPRYTGEVLDILKSKNVPATFFIIGENAEQQPELLRRELAEGHEIGNHTYTHPNVSNIAKRQLQFELSATQRLLESLIGRETLLFRPPYADDIEPETPDQMLPIVVTSKLGYVVVGMGIDPNDWESPPADKIVSDIVAQAEAGKGNVILLHDSGGSREQTLKALPGIIDQLRSRGYHFVLVSNLIGKSRDEVMPVVPPSTMFAVQMNAFTFGLVHVLSLILGGFFIAGIVLGVLRFAFIGTLAVVERRGERSSPRLRAFDPTYLPSVAVVIAAYNEEKVILQTIRTLLATSYKGTLEIIVVDDGSTDGTYAVVKKEFGRGFDREWDPEFTGEFSGDAHVNDARVQLYTQINAGKAAALNNGIARTQADIVVTLDADTVFTPDTLPLLVRHFSDPSVGAVAGNAKVGNRINLLTRFQALEYITSQNLDRRAFSALNCITVVPGAVGAWRRYLLIELGGFTHDTLAEDTDLTMAVRKLGYHIRYEGNAIALTEAPDTVRDLIKQRYRWMFGTLQATWKHRDVLFRRKYGAFGFIAVPNVIIFQIIFPLISPVMDLMVVLSAVTSAVNFAQHPETFSPSSLLVISAYYSLFLLVDVLTSGLAFALEKGEDARLLWWLLLQRFCYRQIMYYVAIKAFFASLSGIVVGWNKLDRKATVTVLSRSHLDEKSR